MELTPRNTNTERQPVAWGPLTAFVTIFLGYTLASILFYFAKEYVPADIKELLLPDNESWATLVYQVSGVLPIIFAIFVAIVLSKGKIRDLGFRRTRPGEVITSSLTVFATYVFITIVISNLLAFVLSDGVLNAEQDLGMDTAFDSFSTALPLLISVLVLAPISEEIVFRGFIFNGMRKKFSFWTSAIVSSLLFAAVHFQLNVAIDVFVLAIGAAWLVERTGSIYASILLHVLKNSVAIMLLVTGAV